MTVRNIIRPAVGGTDLRVRLTNAYGDRPLHVGHVYVGVPSSGPALEAGSNRLLTFADDPEITLAPGTTALSDPLPGLVAAGRRLAITLYLRGPSGTLTGRNRATSPSLPSERPGMPAYRSLPGDHAADESGAPFVEEATVWHWLDSLTVVPPAPVQVVAVLGDSITTGVGSESGQGWPDFLRLPVANDGISGGKLLTAGPGHSAETRLTTEVLSKPGITTVIVQAGINDVGAGAQAEDLIAAYERMAVKAHAAGVRLIVGTLTPFEGAEYWTTERERTRQKVNSFLRRSATPHHRDAAPDLRCTTPGPQGATSEHRSTTPARQDVTIDREEATAFHRQGAMLHRQRDASETPPYAGRCQGDMSETSHSAERCQGDTPETSHSAGRCQSDAFGRRGAPFDRLADFDAVLRDPACPTRLLPAYDSGDHLHPSTAGHRAMATAVDLRAPRPS
ncbi:GDSL-type esterase/lipase family protein [Nonomuraea sp. NPDC049421]|uniref:GDSL-type esterase/lipase family protein n=1 Tax=Nonomuraea sp. NPDC049421 TaxID=3155275 RepID=UPI00343B5563